MLAHAAARGDLLLSSSDNPQRVIPDYLTDQFSLVYAFKDSAVGPYGVAESLAAMTIQPGTEAYAPHTSGYPQFVLRRADWFDDSIAGHSHRVAAWKASNAEAPVTRAASAHWRWMRDCQGTGITRRNPPQPMPRSIPALVVSFRYDSATPWLWADRLATALHAPLVTYNGFGHGAYDVHTTADDSAARRDAAACVAVIVDRFLLTTRHTGPRPVCSGETAA